MRRRSEGGPSVVVMLVLMILSMRRSGDINSSSIARSTPTAVMCEVKSIAIESSTPIDSNSSARGEEDFEGFGEGFDSGIEGFKH